MEPATEPKTITILRPLKFGEFKPTGQNLFGIYKFDGDRLVVAYREGGPRPDTFESNPGSGVTLLVLEKPKPPASQKPVESKSGNSQTPSGATKGG